MTSRYDTTTDRADALFAELADALRELEAIREAIAEARVQPDDMPRAIAIRLIDALERHGVALPLDSDMVQ